MPQYMSSNNNNIYRFFKSIELLIFNFLLKKVDSFIFVTDFFPSKLRIGDRPWMVLEGTYTIKNDYKPFITSLINPSKIIMYSGTLDSRYGILDLLDAFKLIKEQYSDYELWICGDGDMKGHIANMAENDTQITYFGQINHDHVLELQAKANVLVNPRRPEGEYTKYSFPIKTIEYLASGRPCVMHGLAGLPAEYIEHLFIPKQVNAESLAEMIVYVCNMDAGIMDDHCRKAYDFVKYKKTPHYQFNRVKSFLLES
jgi:glycosyltransferase involved in cell wall biosynthesis